MKSAIFASLISTASAFAPVQQTVSSTSLKAFEDALGSQPPLGFFDPLGLVEDGDQEKFDRLRFVEIKHGRICMLAFLGQITTRAGLHLPGNIDLEGNSFDSFPDGAAALFGPDAIPSAGFGQIIAFIGALELAVMKDVTGEAEFAGDFRNGALDFGWDTFGPETVSFRWHCLDIEICDAIYHLLDVAKENSETLTFHSKISLNLYLYNRNSASVPLN
uniref:Fucoxanthin-chlorophyll a/c light-harvesting protein n=1 Tax=Pseudo-nitzschia australis TaxID=44445 RepID=A0A7S4ARP1_9STRA